MAHSIKDHTKRNNIFITVFTIGLLYALIILIIYLCVAGLIPQYHFEGGKGFIPL